jgi:crossover junction endodeoxyribonuclease RuvC
VIYIGIDPGQGGGIAWIWGATGQIETAKYGETDKILDLFGTFYNATIVLERVHSMPKQGVRSVFTFGTNYGWWQGVMTACGCAWQDVEPRVWQRHLGCLTGGQKNVTKAFATKLVAESGSGVRVTHAVADAICLAEYARRTAAGS